MESCSATSELAPVTPGAHTRRVLPQQRFDNFESVFSCSPKPQYYYDTATALYSQNTGSMQWCAEAFGQGYRLLNDPQDLRSGEY